MSFTTPLSRFSKVALAAALAVNVGAAQAATDPVDFTNSTAYGTGVYTIEVNNIRINAEVANPFDPSRPQIITYTYNLPFRFDLSSLHFVPELSGARPVTQSSSCASLNVAVTDAYTGYAISGALANVGVSPATSSSTGTASFTGLVAGSNSVTVSASGYTTASQVVELSCTAATNVGIALNPTSGAGAISANSVRIILTWGDNPRDLDSHLTGPTSSSTGTTDTTNRYHVYFSSKTRECDTTNTTSCVTRLDVDDTSGLGPETVTIAPPSGSSTLRAGLYRYTIHHYSGSNTIATSGANVRLLLGNSSERTFTPSSSTTLGGSGSIWTVFELMVDSSGQITVLPVDTYSTATSASAVRSRTGLGSVENGVDFARLPAK